MPARSLRVVERLSRMEERMIDYCDELTELNHSVKEISDTQRESRHELRRRRLNQDLQNLWIEYSALVYLTNRLRNELAIDS